MTDPAELSEPDDNPPRCKSCGVPWRDHLGCEGLCAKSLEQQAKIDHLRAMVADAILCGMVIESCDRCGGEILSIPRDEHSEGILWCMKCARAEAGGEG